PAPLDKFCAGSPVGAPLAGDDDGVAFRSLPGGAALMLKCFKLRKKRRWRLSAPRKSASSALRSPCFCAFRRVFALPASLRGPVERSQGLSLRIRAACSRRRFGGQPLVILRGFWTPLVCSFKIGGMGGVPVVF